MADHLDAVLDHVAIAVPAWEPAERRWRDDLGGGVVAFGKTPAFWSRQLRFAGGGKLELLAPPPETGPDNFVRRFLDRFGAHLHHVTLKVPDLMEAVAVLRAAGLEPVDIRADNPYWHEAFLRPSEAGGIVVQVAYAGQSDEEWARKVGLEPERPRPGAATLTGPLLEHPDLAAAERLWRLLGAEIARDDSGLMASWPRSPLTVRIARGPAARAVALLGHGVPPQQSDPETGPELRFSGIPPA
ncbi:MAG TPA: VOC family protein [Egibacteraceae bacterium]|nr:VOC family protein [Egibacteraceae bacterium]